MRENIVNFLLTILSVVFLGIGVSFSVKADIGLGSIDAFNLSWSYLTGYDIGTMTTVTNMMCVFLQILILRKNFRVRQFLQIPVSFVLGISISMILTYVLSHITITHYPFQLILAVIGYIIAAISVGCMIALNCVSSPIEALGLVLCEKGNFNFRRFRQWYDVCLVGFAIIVCSILQEALPIREGTIISILMYAKIASWVRYKLEQTHFIKRIRIQ
ncbi:YitT family protein [Carnobacteriaceae bacterium zg-84]|uniref:YczE/YyaS/YitT family protein n=1 Tax=Granulicatella sp. zg-84 TaxID=2678503 RepID=UPI0013C265E5|nr:YitT family protein [Granulicatella sp. zg-84]NEW65719.1 hypothetical protein [Granulicatella sp. zg-84]QMI86527.1 YitT family protein [Carnobacteriaceae bacterium zg-84]